MSSNVLLVVADAAEAQAVLGMLLGARGSPFKVEWVTRGSDACTRLCSDAGEKIAVVVVDLCLPDMQGVQTIDSLISVSPRIPILVLSEVQDEDAARLAVQRGAQDYLLKRRFDAISLSRALSSMLARAARADAQHESNERERLTLNSIGDAVVSTDLQGNITFINPVAERMIGWSRQLACGRPLREVLRIIDGESRAPSPDPLAMAIERNEIVGLGPNSLLVRSDGQEIAIEDTASPVHDGFGRLLGAVMVFRDVSVARATSVRMSYLAQHDYLTKLPNRMLLIDRLTQAIAAARRHGKSLALLFVDVDHFKHVNDSRGHLVGDGVLQSVARRLVDCVRTTDTVSRHGGDEFIVLLSEVSRSRDAAVSADKILVALSAPHHVDAQDVQITVSIGIGVFPADGTGAGLLIKSADMALLNAKNRGRNRREFFESMEQRSASPARLGGRGFS